MEEQSASRPRRMSWPLVGIWAGVLACALALGAWVRDEGAARRQREGERLAIQVAELASRARTVGDPATGAKLLEEARELLEGAGAAGPSRAGLLVDLASLLVRSPSGENLPLARALLEEAWATADLAAPLRARIARDRGAVELLAGEAETAQEWYERAAAPAPGDGGAPGGPLETLRRSTPGGEARGR